MEKNLSQPALAALLSLLIAIRAYRYGLLNLSGSISGFIILFIHLSINYRFGAMLLVFLFASSKFTKFGEDRKRKLDADLKEGGGQRDWCQVIFNSGLATLLVLGVWKLIGSQDKCLDSEESRLRTSLIGGIIGQYCCCNGDIWSSELGILGNEKPRLITTFKRVRMGTKGGVTKTGLLAAITAGNVIGLTFVVVGIFTADCTSDVASKQLMVIPLSGMAGLFGSLIDSLLGATLQFSGFCVLRKKVVGKPGPTVRRISGAAVLGNNAVRLISMLLTTAITSFAFSRIF